MATDTLRNLLFFAGLLGSVVIVHELGHLVAALMCGVRIDEVGLGLPPRVRRLGKLGSISFTLNALPLGGFVRPAGEFDADVQGGLAAAGPASRLVTLSAGAAANLLLAVCLLTTGFATGWPDQVEVTSISPGSPAETAGVRPGDILVYADEQPVHNAGELRDLLASRAGAPLALEFERSSVLQATALTPRVSPPSGEGPAGFASRGVVVTYALPTALRRGAEEIGRLVQRTAGLFADLVRGEQRAGDVRLTGPLGMKQASDKALENAVAWDEPYPVIYVAAWLSTMLGLTNMLPLPALDGGRIVFVLIEIIRRRQISDRVEKWVHAAGMAGILLLLVVLTVQDVLHPLF
jgi:regulator of sigma E protease